MSKNNSTRIIWCHIGSEKFGLTMHKVRTVQGTSQLRINPDGDTPFAWLATTIGDLPILNVAKLFDIETKAPLYSQRVVLVNDPIQMWGFLADEVDQAIEISADNQFPLPKLLREGDTPYFSDLIRHKDEYGLLIEDAILHRELRTKTRKSRRVEKAREAEATIAAVKNNVNRQSAQNGTPSESSTTSPNQAGRLLVCTLPSYDKFSIGLSATQVAEVSKQFKLIRVPAASSAVKGVMLWRQRAIPVVDFSLHSKLQKANGDAGEENIDRLMVARTSDADPFIAFPIEPQVDMHRLPVKHSLVSKRRWPKKADVRVVVQIQDKNVLIPVL